jgi:hypothetical protein
MEWTEAILSIGVGSGGLAVAVRACIAITHELARRSRHEAGRAEADALTVRGWMDEMRGRMTRVEEENAKLIQENAGLKEIVEQLLADITELRNVVATGRGSMPPLRLYESLRPPAVEEKNGGKR